MRSHIRIFSWNMCWLENIVGNSEVALQGLGANSVGLFIINTTGYGDEIK